MLTWNKCQLKRILKCVNFKNDSYGPVQYTYLKIKQKEVIQWKKLRLFFHDLNLISYTYLRMYLQSSTYYRTSILVRCYFNTLSMYLRKLFIRNTISSLLRQLLSNWSNFITKCKTVYLLKWVSKNVHVSITTCIHT